MAARTWIVSGRVQGVGFRAFVIRSARALGLSGWVRNRTTGDVEVVARGESSALDALADDLRLGPRFARVDHVEAHPLDEDNAATSGFVVRPDQ